MTTTNSASIAAALTSPPTKSDVRHSGGRVRVKSETVEIPAAFAAADQVRFFTVKAHDSIKSIRMWSDDIATTSCTIDWGIYPAGAGSAVISLDCYATDVNHAVAIIDQELRYEILDINTMNQAVWQDAGVSTEPAAGTEYELVATVVAVTLPLTGTISVLMTYTSGD